MTWLLTLPGKIAASVGVALVAVLAFLARLRIERAAGKREAQQEARDDAAKRVEKGREAVADGRQRGSPDDRLRHNDGAW